MIKLTRRQSSMVLIVLLLTFSGFVSSATAPKIEPADLVAKHLASLGTPEAIAAVQNRVMEGKVTAVFKVGHTGSLAGTAAIASEGSQLSLKIAFNDFNYPGEKMASDGKRVSVGMVKAGIRSPLSQFFHDYGHALMTEGLLGGTTSVGWPLLSLKERKARLDYRGVKKIAGKELLEVRYRPSRSDFSIALYFEPDTFRHVRSQYELRIASVNSDAGAMHQDPDTIWTVIEEFADFKTAEGLTLPSSYKLGLNYDGLEHSFVGQWTFTFDQAKQNQQLDSKTFTVE